MYKSVPQIILTRLYSASQLFFLKHVQIFFTSIVYTLKPLRMRMDVC